MRSFYALTLALWATGGLAAPAKQHSVIHEKRGLSREWRRLNRVARDVVLPMRIGLTQNNLDAGHEMLMRVYVLDLVCTLPTGL